MSTRRQKSPAVRFLEDLAGPLTLGAALAAIREGEEWSQAEMARRLGISRSHLCDIEKRRKSVSPGRAAEFAEALGYGKRQFVRLALQELVNEAGLDLEVSVA